MASQPVLPELVHHLIKVDGTRTVLCVARELASLSIAVGGGAGVWPFTSEVLEECWRELALASCEHMPSEPPHPRADWPSLTSAKMRAMLKNFFSAPNGGPKEDVLQRLVTMADSKPEHVPWNVFAAARADSNRTITKTKAMQTYLLTEKEMGPLSFVAGRTQFGGTRKTYRLADVLYACRRKYSGGFEEARDKKQSAKRRRQEAKKERTEARCQRVLDALTEVERAAADPSRQHSALQYARAYASYLAGAKGVTLQDAVDGVREAAFLIKKTNFLDFYDEQYYMHRQRNKWEWQDGCDAFFRGPEPVDTGAVCDDAAEMALDDWLHGLRSEQEVRQSAQACGMPPTLLARALAEVRKKLKRKYGGSRALKKRTDQEQRHDGAGVPVHSLMHVPLDGCKPDGMEQQEWEEMQGLGVQMQGGGLGEGEEGGGGRAAPYQQEREQQQGKENEGRQEQGPSPARGLNFADPTFVALCEDLAMENSKLQEQLKENSVLQ